MAVKKVQMTSQVIICQQPILKVHAYWQMTVQVVMTLVDFVDFVDWGLHIDTSYERFPFFPPVSSVAFLSKPVIAPSSFAASLGNMRPRRV
jgi:hypothetical protein